MFEPPGFNFSPVSLFDKKRFMHMKPYVANLIFSILLIILSIWGYLASEAPSLTAFIPTGFGIIFLALTFPMKKGSKTIAHLVAGLTLLLIFAFIKPLLGAIDRNDILGIVRVAIMIAAGIGAFGVYVNSFIQARKNRP